MSKPKLVIMAAGLGSRFGGMKQIAPVDHEGHIIMDFSMYDAKRAGFEEVVFIVKPEMQDYFHEKIGSRVEKHMRVHYAYQTLDTLPDGYSVPEGRVKPWGTAHAVMCAAEYLDGPFAVINADDYYGPSAFEAVYRFLNGSTAENEHAMVGYRLENTLSENGSVARGVCLMDENGYLSQIDERTRIEKRPGGAAFTEDGETFTFLPGNTLVSMNLWGFRQSVVPELKKQFIEFLDGAMPQNPLKAEFYLPYVPKKLIAEGNASVRVLKTEEKWFGVTYLADMEHVQAAVQQKKAEGLYPDLLWGE